MDSDIKICGIYKIKNNVNNKIYIGQSVDITRRWKAHRVDAFNPNVAQKYKSLLYSAIRKYGLDNFKFEIIEECNKESLNEKEIFWIEYYNSNNPKLGYNMTPGGSNPAEINFTKCYQYNLDGYFIAEFESIVNASETTGTNKSSISRCCHGNIKSAGGYIWKLYKVAKIEGYNSEREVVPIYQYSKKGELIKIYESMSIASELSGFNVSGICSCCNHSVKSFCGYVWRKEGDPFSYSNNMGNNRVTLVVINQNDEIVNKFSSYKEAQGSTGIDQRTIKKLCSNEHKDKNGNRWMKEEDYAKYD